jgi:CBS domain-containing protein
MLSGGTQDMNTVKEILKEKSKEIWSVTPKAMVFEALTLMGEKEIGALMVIDDAGKVHGIISERDYARKVILKGKSSRETAVEEIMTPNEHMFTVKPENTAEECMVLITGKHIRHLPVFDGDKFMGLVSIGDIVKSKIAEQEKLIEHLSNYIAGKYV